jgi:hypothetical protein
LKHSQDPSLPNVATMTTVAEESVRGLMRLTTVPNKLIQGTDGPLSWELRRAQKHPLRGMLSLEEIRNWGDSVAAESTFKLIEFCHKPAKPAGRAVTQIVFEDGGNEYRVWIFRNTSFTLLAFTKVYRPIFSEDVTRRSLECISRILRRSLA